MKTKSEIAREIHAILRPDKPYEPEALGLYRLSKPQVLVLLADIQNLANKELDAR